MSCYLPNEHRACEHMKSYPLPLNLYNFNRTLSAPRSTCACSLCPSRWAEEALILAEHAADMQAFSASPGGRWWDYSKIGPLLCHIEISLYWNWTSYTNKYSRWRHFPAHRKSCKIFRIIVKSENMNLNEKKKIFMLSFRVSNQRYDFMPCQRYCYISSTKWCLWSFCIHSAVAADSVPRCVTTLWATLARACVAPAADYL